MHTPVYVRTSVLSTAHTSYTTAVNGDALSHKVKHVLGVGA